MNSVAARGFLGVDHASAARGLTSSTILGFGRLWTPRLQDMVMVKDQVELFAVRPDLRPRIETKRSYERLKVTTAIESALASAGLDMSMVMIYAAGLIRGSDWGGNNVGCGMTRLAGLMVITQMVPTTEATRGWSKG